MIAVVCDHCGKSFEVADSLVGGLANCPACGKATPVEGLRDPWFRLIQVGTAVGWALLTAIGWSAGGWLGAAIVGGGSALVIALIFANM